MNNPIPEPRETCTGCERTTDDGLVPWAGQRLCWSCVDLHLDLLALAVADLMLAASEAASPPEAHPAMREGVVTI
jgi:hypothetical protein